MLHADVKKAPQPSITLHWNSDPYAKGYRVWRKERLDAQWSAQPIATLDSTKTSFTDDDAVVGVGYEYQVLKNCVRKIDDSSQLVYFGSGYIFSGIDRAPEALPGAVLLVVDSTMAGPLAMELTRLQNDLMAEGWRVVMRQVGRTETFSPAAVAAVKTVILNEYRQGPDLTTVFLIGRIAVPYSGDINPDGHPDHRGAWPADAFYADMEGNWSDESVNDPGAGRAENKNIIGDGKYDESVIPSLLTLAVGRADFYNMPAFTTSERELLRTYLNKDHAFRTGALKPTMAGVIDDNFSAASYPEAFSSAAWRAFSLFGGEQSVTAGDWFSTLGGSTTYLWAYGCGGGTYTSAGGIGSTDNFTNSEVHAVFTMLFGSYFGDWDVQNSFLRAPLCTPQAVLTNAWVARPQWYFHHMALGETIGYSTLLSQNNGNFYIPNAYFTQQYPQGILYTVGNQYVHVALMGDPTLRAQMESVPKPGQLVVTVDTVGGPVVRLVWAQATGAVDGYFIYRTFDDTVQHSSEGTKTELLNLVPVTGTSYVDSSQRHTTEQRLSARYFVRAARRYTTASGTYFQGGSLVGGDLVQLAGVAGQGEAAFAFDAAPNPASHMTQFVLSLPQAADATIDVFDLEGHLVRHIAAEAFGAGVTRRVWDLCDKRGIKVPTGVYVAQLNVNGHSEVRKVVVR